MTPAPAAELRPEGLARRAAGWLPVLGYCAMIFYFSSRTGGSMPRWEFLRHDKILHACEYSGLGLLLAFAAVQSIASERRVVVLAMALALAWAVGDEFHQTFVPGRQGNDPGDLAADAAGSTAGVVAFISFRRLAARRSSVRVGAELPGRAR